MPTASIDDVLRDPEFHKQPLGWRLDVLRRNYPEFSSLSANDQGRLVAKTQQDVVGTTAAVENSGGTPDPGFFSTLGHGLASMPAAFTQLTRLLNTGQVGEEAWGQVLHGFAKAQAAQFQEGRDARAQGNFVEGAGHTAAGALPLYGPAAGEIGSNIGEGHYGQAAANALLLGGPEVWNKLGPQTQEITRNVRNVNNPVEERAIQSVVPGVRMTPGQRSGQTGLQAAERNLRNMPGTSAEAEQFFRGMQDDLAAEGSRRVGQQGLTPGTSPQNTNPYGAGQAIQQTLKDRIAALKQFADKTYESTRQTTARNLVKVQTGTEEIPASSILAPNGQPISPPQTVPVFADMESPVALAPIRAQLKDIYTDLSKNLPEAKRANSPAYRALDEFMQSDIEHMNAMDFDKFLGAVKSITRDGNSEFLSTQSQRLARKVVAAGETEFQDALSGAGPNVASKLQSGRKAVRAYYDTADLLDDMRSEPAALYSNLTTGGDRVTDTLLDLRNKAPKAVDVVGRTYLNEMIDKATREGGWGRSAGVKADWEKLGPETKKILFGPQVTKSMDDFLLAAKRLTPAVGSPTADRLAALASYGDVGIALTEFLTGVAFGHPGAGLMAAGTTMMATRGVPGLLAKLSFLPKGADLLHQALTLPINSPAFNHTMSTLGTMAVNNSAPAPPTQIVAGQSPEHDVPTRIDYSGVIAAHLTPEGREYLQKYGKIRMRDLLQPQ